MNETTVNLPTGVFQDWMLALLRKLMADTDTLFDFVASFLPGLKVAVEKTATKLDDMAVRCLEVALTDDDLREQFKAWLSGLLSAPQRLAASDVPLRDYLAADDETVRLCQQVAGRLNIDWQKILDLIAKYLPIILPLILDPAPEA